MKFIYTTLAVLIAPIIIWFFFKIANYLYLFIFNEIEAAKFVSLIVTFLVSYLVSYNIISSYFNKKKLYKRGSKFPAFLFLTFTNDSHYHINRHQILLPKTSHVKQKILSRNKQSSYQLHFFVA